MKPVKLVTVHSETGATVMISQEVADEFQYKGEEVSYDKLIQMRDKEIERKEALRTRADRKADAVVLAG